MFAKVFEQIFDSSIAEDYNCRRMFMDLLVLADSTGAVDMTVEAISRRTNVPVDEVVKYVKELCQPDTKSRSKLEEGKRLVPLDSNRDWGWKIVNYVHYRKIRDEAARREYFRDKQREHRKKVKRDVKDTVLTELNEHRQMLTSASSSTSSSVSVMKPKDQKEVEAFCISIGLQRSDGEAMWLEWQEHGLGKTRDWRAKIRKWKIHGYHPSQKKQSRPFRNNSEKPLDKSKIDVPERFKAWVSERYPEQRERAMKWQTWADVGSNGLREEWWREEKKKLPIGDLL